MSQKIAELECQISDLHWIRKEEIPLDYVVALGAGPPVNSAELDSTIPVAVILFSGNMVEILVTVCIETEFFVYL